MHAKLPKPLIQVAGGFDSFVAMIGRLRNGTRYVRFSWPRRMQPGRVTPSPVHFFPASPLLFLMAITLLHPPGLVVKNACLDVVCRASNSHEYVHGFHLVVRVRIFRPLSDLPKTRILGGPKGVACYKHPLAAG